MTRVYVSSNSNSNVYHTRECDKFPHRYSEWDRETAEAWGKTECSYCAKDVDWSRNGGGRWHMLAEVSDAGNN